LFSSSAAREAPQASDFAYILISKGKTPKQRENKPAKQDSEVHANDRNKGLTFINLHNQILQQSEKFMGKQKHEQRKTHTSTTPA
jgi:hypothetical protein